MLCRIAWWLGVPAALLLGIGIMWGPVAAGLGLVQALLAIIILEDVNYIEHYGLQRALTRTGRRASATLQPPFELSAPQATCFASADTPMLVPLITSQVWLQCQSGAEDAVSTRAHGSPLVLEIRAEATEALQCGEDDSEALLERQLALHQLHHLPAAAALRPPRPRAPPLPGAPPAASHACAALTCPWIAHDV